MNPICGRIECEHEAPFRPHNGIKHDKSLHQKAVQEFPGQPAQIDTRTEPASIFSQYLHQHLITWRLILALEMACFPGAATFSELKQAA